MNKLLITKSSLTKEEYHSLTELGLDVVNQSFIEFKAVDFLLPRLEDFSWIFFSSPRAFDYFSSKTPIKYIESKKIACVGRKTAEHINKKGFNCDFIGQKSGDVSTVATALKDLVGSKTLLFPISQKSNKSMQRCLSKEQCLNLVVYHTISKSIKLLKHFDILVFTSPSNLNSFLESNLILPGQKIIAWGSTTKQEVEKCGYKCYLQLDESSIETLAYQIKNHKELFS